MAVGGDPGPGSPLPEFGDQLAVFAGHHGTHRVGYDDAGGAGFQHGFGGGTQMFLGAARGVLDRHGDLLDAERLRELDHVDDLFYRLTPADAPLVPEVDIAA